MSAADRQDASDGLHPLLASRFSPLRFDSRVEVEPPQVDVLLEAARWAPSAGNSQPWAFFTTRRGDDDHSRVVRHLAPSSARWAPDAGLLIVTSAHRYVDDSDLPYSEFADYDLGQAVAHLTLQAQAMRLACRQFRAFDLAGITDELRPAPGWQVVSMIAIGQAADGGAGERQRRSVDELRYAAWGDGAR